AAAVPQGLALLANDGLAAFEVGLVEPLGPGDLQVGAGQAAIELAVVALGDVAIGTDLRSGMGHLAVVDADGADDHLLGDLAGRLVGHALHALAAVDVELDDT